MSTPDILAAIGPIVSLFEQLGIAYSVVGSVASSAHGIARATLDVDLVVDLHRQHVVALVDELQDDYYIDRDAVLDAIARRAMFNVVHLATMLKVDVYVLSERPFDRASFLRRRPAPLDEGDHARPYLVDTPEDTVLHKLEWYRAGGETSERQWNDIVGVLKVQGSALDLAYMRHWSASLGLDELLDRVLRESDLFGE